MAKKPEQFEIDRLNHCKKEWAARAKHASVWEVTLSLPPVDAKQIYDRQRNPLVAAVTMKRAIQLVEQRWKGCRVFSVNKRGKFEDRPLIIDPKLTGGE